MFSKEWQEFREQVIPGNASDIQVGEMKKAFYSGALALISLTSQMLSDGSEVTEEDVSNYDSLVREIVDTCKSFLL